MSQADLPFDAILLISFGGPQGRANIRPFLMNVLRGRRIPQDRIEEVVRHYELFDGVSPLTAITTRQANGLRERLETRGPALPVYIGMRNWHPFLTDTLSEMSEVGISRALAVIMAAHHSYSSCGQYRQNVIQARQVLRERTGRDIEITYVDGWHDHPDFISANADHIKAALTELPSDVRGNARIIFTAHSIPREMADESRYELELRESANLVARALSTKDWAIAFQSRSGRQQDQWLEPDICNYLRIEYARGLQAAVICPLGFVADHIEVLYDLDQEAADVGRDLGLPLCRAAAVNDAPAFLDMMADMVRKTCARGRMLPLLSTAPPEDREGPPLAR